MRKSLSVALVVAVFLFSLVSVTNAAIISVKEQWRLGEDDAGAVIGQPGNTSTIHTSPGGGGVAVDGVKVTNTLGSPTYVAGAYPGSTLALNFTNPASDSSTDVQYYKANGPKLQPSDTYGFMVPSPSTNFGVDFWFKPTGTYTSGEHTIIQFGGYGSPSSGNVWAVEFEVWGASSRLLVSDWGTGAYNADFIPPTDSWTHVAWINDNGSGRLFINGTEFSNAVGKYTGTGSYNYGAGIPNMNYLFNNFYAGARNYNGTIATGFSGAVDEARVFTFSGTFDIHDLDPVPEPGTLVLLAGGVAGLLAYAYRKRN